MRILVTGSRDWTDRAAIAEALRPWIEQAELDGQDALAVGRSLPPAPVLVHGGCPTGADALADGLFASWGLPREVHPADWSTHGKPAGPIRNAEMVALGATVVLAFPLGASRGTRNCMRLARKAGLFVREVTS